jgi:hypothetical protein
MVAAYIGQFATLPIGQHGRVVGTPSYDAPAAAWAEFYTVNKIGVLVGTGGYELAWVLLIFWTVQFTLMLWRLNRGTGARILVAGTGAAALSIPFLMMLVCAFWAVAAYRASTVNPEIIQVLNDLGSIGSFIWFWTALVTMGLSGYLMLQFSEGPGAFPRWLGWLGIACGLTQLPAITCQFIYSGTWALNGLMGWYFPMAGWVVWMVAISFVMFGMIKRSYREVARTSEKISLP